MPLIQTSLLLFHLAFLAWRKTIRLLAAPYCLTQLHWLLILWDSIGPLTSQMISPSASISSGPLSSPMRRINGFLCWISDSLVLISIGPSFRVPYLCFDYFADFYESLVIQLTSVAPRTCSCSPNYFFICTYTLRLPITTATILILDTSYTFDHFETHQCLSLMLRVSVRTQDIRIAQKL